MGPVGSGINLCCCPRTIAKSAKIITTAVKSLAIKISYAGTVFVHGRGFDFCTCLQKQPRSHGMTERVRRIMFNTYMRRKSEL